MRCAGHLLAICVGASMALGCGSELSSDFEGSWREQSARETEFCTDDLGSATSSHSDVTIRLRLVRGALQYSFPSGTEACVRMFSLNGTTAEIQPNQACDIWVSGTDPNMASPIKTGLKVHYLEGHLTLDGDTLHESGKLQSDGSEACHAFERELVRVQ